MERLLELRHADMVHGKVVGADPVELRNLLWLISVVRLSRDVLASLSQLLDLLHLKELFWW